MARGQTLAYLKTESGAGLILALAALGAVIAANSPASGAYFALIDQPIPVRLGAFAETRSLAGWVKDGLMAAFFLVVGMEIKFEILRGELSSPRRLALPLIAALGGMIAPAAIYLALNLGPGGAPRGWPVATPTDIAFALAGLALFAPKLPPPLRVFLLTLAIADDLGAVALIAILYSGKLDPHALVGAGAVLAALAAASRWKQAPDLLYAIGFALVWGFTLESGVSPSIGAIACAFTVPIAARRADRESALKAFMDALHPYVAFGVLPLFAFTAAGFSLRAIGPAPVASAMPLGILLGLAIGKPLGVFGFSLAAATAKLGRRPTGVAWSEMFGAALLCGAGFTLSLYIGALAFSQDDLAAQGQVRLAVLAASLISVLAGGLVLSRAQRTRLEREDGD